MHALRPSMPLLLLSSDAHRATRRGFGWSPGSKSCLLGTLVASALQHQRRGGDPFHSAACCLCVSVSLPAPTRSGWKIPSPPYGGCSETVNCKLSTANCSQRLSKSPADRAQSAVNVRAQFPRLRCLRWLILAA